MATIQVIIWGIPGGTVHDTDEYPVVLHFEEGNTYEEASWVIPSYPGYVPGEDLSEIRVISGKLKVVVDSADGFQSGPHSAAWVKGGYPRGKLCSFLDVDAARKVFSVSVEAGEVVLEEMAPAGGAPSSQ